MNWETTKRTIWWVLIIALLANVPAIAAMQGEEEHPMMGQQEQERMREMGALHSADEMLGSDVQTSTGEKVGTIEDLVVDTYSNRVFLAIISAEAKLYPVPRSAFKTHQKGVCVLNISKDQLMNAPSYDRVQPSDLDKTGWGQRIMDYYRDIVPKETPMGKAAEYQRQRAPMELEGKEEWAARVQPGRFAMLSKLIGMDIKGADDKDLAEVDNILIDPQTGHLAYAIVSYGGLAGVGEKLAAIPWAALDIQPNLEYASLDADTATLEKVTIVEEDIMKLNEPGYARRFYVVFDEEPYWEVFGFVPAMPQTVDAWQAQSSYNRNFDPARVETIEGKIRSVGSFAPQKGAARGLKLKVETADGKKMTVYAGPRIYAWMQGVTFQKGSDVTVTGSKATIGEKSVIMASQVTSEGKTLKLRDEQGKPMWNVEALKQKMEQRKSMPEKGVEKESMY